MNRVRVLSQVLLYLFMMIILTGIGCGKKEKESTAGNEPAAFIYVPGGVFVEGTPPPANGNSSNLVVTNAVPSGELSMNSTITWTVTWTVSVTVVAYVYLYIPETGGYFEIPVDSTDAADGEIIFDMTKSDTQPASGCVGTGIRNNVWCWADAPTGTTEDASVTLAGSGSDVGQSMGGIGITWGNNTVCGDGTCESGETESSCPGDCGSSGGTCGGSGEPYCYDTSMCGVNYSACSNDGATWYELNGSVYCCASSTDCADAAATVAGILSSHCK